MWFITIVVVLFLTQNFSCNTLVNAFEGPQLSVMTFNIWVSGLEVDNGIEKIANHIKQINSDIVALQEVISVDAFVNITELLGDPWNGYIRNASSYPGVGILTRHTIIDDSQVQTDVGVGVRITIKIDQPTPALPLVFNVTFWSIHLQYRSYGPYAACNKLVTVESQITDGEVGTATTLPSRVQQIKELLADDSFKTALVKSSDEPVIVAGDFNTPSHLDWTTSTKDMHCGWQYDWPTTKLLTDEASMIDSFRAVHPDPKLEPGTTWSTVEKFSSSFWGWNVSEPQDRIDMIFYRGNRLSPMESYAYQGNDTVNHKPNHRTNNYPSDHYAVVTNFRYNVDTSVVDTTTVPSKAVPSCNIEGHVSFMLGIMFAWFYCFKLLY